MALIFECQCGNRIAHSEHRQPVCTVCREPRKKAICHHRGPSAGIASCGCGAVYRCSLLNKYCADQPLKFPLYEINIVNKDGSTGHLLSKNYQSDSRAVSENFQACSECDFNSNKPPPT